MARITTRAATRPMAASTGISITYAIRERSQSAHPWFVAAPTGGRTPGIRIGRGPSSASAAARRISGDTRGTDSRLARHACSGAVRIPRSKLSALIAFARDGVHLRTQVIDLGFCVARRGYRCFAFRRAAQYFRIRSLTAFRAAADIVCRPRLGSVLSAAVARGAVGLLFSAVTARLSAHRFFMPSLNALRPAADKRRRRRTGGCSSSSSTGSGIAGLTAAPCRRCGNILTSEAISCCSSRYRCAAPRFASSKM
jgi:hypothetical protein